MSVHTSGRVPRAVVVKAKRPSESVVAPSKVVFRNTFTPGSGRPAPSSTVPLRRVGPTAAGATRGVAGASWAAALIFASAMLSSTPAIDYQHLFRAIPAALLLMAPDATILDNTDEHVAVSLKARDEIVGRPLFEAFPVHLEPHTMPLIRYDLERPAEQGGGFEELYWQATHYPVLDAAGQLQYILQRT
nr:hypothetical protein [Tanacetum cinerariifolium]